MYKKHRCLTTSRKEMVSVVIIFILKCGQIIKSTCRCNLRTLNPWFWAAISPHWVFFLYVACCVHYTGMFLMLNTPHAFTTMYYMIYIKNAKYKKNHVCISQRQTFSPTRGRPTDMRGMYFNIEEDPTCLPTYLPLTLIPARLQLFFTCLLS